MGSVSIPEVDVLIVGAGFGAFTMLNKYVSRFLKSEGADRGTGFGSLV